MPETFKTNFEVLARQKFKEDGRRFSERAITRETGVNRATVRAYLNDDVQYITRDSVAKLCDWLGCGLHDLIVDDLRYSDESNEKEEEALLPIPA